MRLRKVINLSGVLAVTFPKELCNAVEVEHGDYFEVYLGENKTIVLTKHRSAPNKLGEDVPSPRGNQTTIYDK